MPYVLLMCLGWSVKANLLIVRIFKENKQGDKLRVAEFSREDTR